MGLLPHDTLTERGFLTLSFKRLRLALQALGCFSQEGGPAPSRGLRPPALLSDGAWKRRAVWLTRESPVLALPLTFSVIWSKMLPFPGLSVPHCNMGAAELDEF